MSLKEIAAMTGVSVSTVSRVLNQSAPGCASEETQAKIRAAAKEIGYHPNECARILQKGGAKELSDSAPCIAILFARHQETETDPFFSALLDCVQTELTAQGLRIGKVLYGDKGHAADLKEADGILVLGRCSAELLTRIRLQNPNIVGIWRNSADFQVDEVVCDGRKAAEMAVDYLLKLGHKNIAYIGDCSFEERYVGYCSRLIERGLPLNYRLIKATDQTAGEAKRAMQELLSGNDSFTAVFCANDVSAESALDVLKGKGEGAHTVSVIGIDDIPASPGKKPALTTVHIPRREMAHMAVLLLKDKLQKKHRETVRIEFPCHIVER